MLSWGAARAYCEAIGARLCTYDEINAGETATTGCSYDASMIWSQTPCSVDGADEAYVTSLGAGGGSASCQDASETTFYARCCADASTCAPTLAPVFAPTPTPTSTAVPTGPQPTPSPTPALARSCSASTCHTLGGCSLLGPFSPLCAMLAVS